MTRTSVCLSVLFTLLAVSSSLSQAEIRAKPQSKTSVDLHGDALPPGALARFGTVRLRLASGTWSVALNPDGSLVATTESGAVRLWNTKTGEKIERFCGNTIRGEFVTFSLDGAVLLTGNRKGLIQHWEVSSGRLIREFKEKFENAFPLGDFSSGRSVLILNGSMRAAVLLDVATGQEILRLDKQKAMHVFDVSPDGKLAAVAGTKKGLICLWDTGTGELRQELHGSQSGALWVKFSPDGKRVACALWHDDLRIWDVSSGKEILKSPECGENGNFSPDSRTLAVYRDGEICLLDVETGRVLRKLEGDHRRDEAVVFSANGRLLAGAANQTVHLWDSDTGKQLPVLPGHQSHISSIAFSPDSKCLVSGSGFGGLIVWDIATSRSLHIWNDFLHGVSAVAWSPDGSVIAAGESGGNDNREVLIRLFDPRAGRLLREIPTHLNAIFTLSYSPDGKQLASVGWDARARIWDPATGKRLHQIRGSDYLRSALFSRDGKTLVVNDQQFEIYQREGWGLLHRLEPAKGERREVRYIGILPDGKTVVTREEWEEKTGERPFDREDRCALCYRNVENGRLLRSVQFQESKRFWMGSCALSQDGDIYIETYDSKDGSGFRVRDAATGKVMGTRFGHTGSISALAFSPDGRRFATGSSDTTILLWDLTEIRVKFWWSELAAKPEERTRAVQQLTASPADALPWIAGQLQTEAEQYGKATRLVSQLDADEFETREKASKGLADMRGAERLALELAQADKRSLEAGRRIEELLEKLPARGKDEESATGQQVFQAIIVLEKIGTPDARKVLSELAKGPTESHLCRAARAALQRLETSQSPEKERPR